MGTTLHVDAATAAAVPEFRAAAVPTAATAIPTAAAAALVARVLPAWLEHIVAPAIEDANVCDADSRRAHADGQRQRQRLLGPREVELAA